MTKTIMVVDDEQHYHDLYETMLRDTDYGIINAYDGDEAMHKAGNLNAYGSLYYLLKK